MTGRVRIAVTGLGVKSPAGTTVADVVSTMLGGDSVAATLPSLVAAGSPVTIGCAVPDFDVTPYLSRREQLKVPRTTVLAMAAAIDAAADAGLGEDAVDPYRLGVFVGTTVPGLSTAVKAIQEHSHDISRLEVHTVTKVMSNSVAATIGLRLNARGPYQTYATACASGTTAIGEAALQIRHGRLDVVVTGGADAPLEPMIMAAFAKVGALSQRLDEPRLASRPFDAMRDGFVMGEGAAFLVLESWDRAVARGARIYGEIGGYGTNSDAFHIVAPRADGEVAAVCMGQALADAGLAAADIGHVNAHGTSTALNDQAEARALERCFGAHAVPVTANKGAVGHLLGAAGAFEAVVALHTATSGEVPPTANFTEGSESEVVDVVAKAPRRMAAAPVLSNSFGFGGHNACLVLLPAGWS